MKNKKKEILVLNLIRTSLLVVFLLALYSYWYLFETEKSNPIYFGLTLIAVLVHALTLTSTEKQEDSAKFIENPHSEPLADTDIAKRIYRLIK